MKLMSKELLGAMYENHFLFVSLSHLADKYLLASLILLKTELSLQFSSYIPESLLLCQWS